LLNLEVGINKDKALFKGLYGIIKGKNVQSFWSVGLMTGTALDGFADVALIKTDGNKVLELGEYALVPYSEEKRNILAIAVKAALEWQFNGPKPEIFAKATDAITEIYINAINTLLKQANKNPSEIDFVGGHGLTVLHIPPKDGQKGKTLQLLDGEKLAKATGIKTIYDFRTNDIENGGQGAPLAPIYHAAMLKYARIKAPAAVLNLGGVANITCWGGDDDLAAFDCGPANGPINEWVEQHGKGTYDKNGELARKGIVHQDVIDNILADKWFNQPYPKSLDRYDYSAKMVAGLSLVDGCATLSSLVAQAINKGLDLFEKRPTTLVIGGGGRKNPKLVEDIKNITKLNIIDADEIGLRGDAIEAECFAFLAVRSALGLPISFSKTTGAPCQLCGGIIANNP
jgi:anhydro-N-acetylmuramic acid kinase